MGESRITFLLVVSCADTSICINLNDCNCFGICLPKILRFCESCVSVYDGITHISLELFSARDSDWMICIWMRREYGAPFIESHSARRDCISECSECRMLNAAHLPTMPVATFLQKDDTKQRRTISFVFCKISTLSLAMFIRLVQFVRFNKVNYVWWFPRYERILVKFYSFGFVFKCLHIAFDEINIHCAIVCPIVCQRCRWFARQSREIY